MRLLIILLLLASGGWLKGQTSEDIIHKEADSLLNVIRKLIPVNKLEEGWQHHAKADSLLRLLPDTMNAAYGLKHHIAGMLYYTAANYKEAEIYYQRAINIRSQVFGNTSDEVAATLNNLAIVHEDQFAFSKAKSTLLECLSIREKLLGIDHPNYATTAYNLARLYNKIGDYNSAIPLLYHSANIRQEAFGEISNPFLNTINLLGNVYYNLSNHDSVDYYFNKATDIATALYGPDHPNTADFLNNLGSFYILIKQFEKAATILKKTIELRREKYGNAHYLLAQSINNYSLALIELGQYTGVEQMVLDAIAICDAYSPPRHLEIIEYTKNLSRYYYYTRNFEKGLEAVTKALSKLESFGIIHEKHSVELKSHLSLYHRSLENFDQAVAIQDEVLNSYEKLYGKENSKYLSAFHNQALNYYFSGDTIKADSYFIRYSELFINALTKNTLFMSVEELESYWLYYQKNLNHLFASTHHIIANEKTAAMYDQLLFQKGYLLQSSKQRINELRDHSELEPLYQEWKTMQLQLTAASNQHVHNEDHSLIIKDQINRLEKQIIAIKPAILQQQHFAKWSEVQDALRPGEAAIEWITNMSIDDSSRYLNYHAIILTSDAQYPVFVPVFNEGQMLNLFTEPSHTYSSVPCTLYEPDKIDKTSPLYKMIWDGIVKDYLHDIHTVYLSPAGILHLINHALLSVSSDKVLGDRMRIVTVSSTRQILDKSENVKLNNQKASVFSGIDFNWFSDSSESIHAEMTYQPKHSLNSINASDIERGFIKDEWPPLKYSEEEGRKVTELLRKAGFISKLYEHQSATEDQFITFGTTSPQVIHIATHGFYRSAIETKNTPSDDLYVNDNPIKRSDNALMRSGLILVGGNYAWKHGHAPVKGMEDGILTAHEISLLDLRNTELVVLSACETGLGDIIRNEGVYGLQRAFKLAGVKYLIVALWKVPDRATMQFMEQFYTAWLMEGIAIPDAFRHTQQQMRELYGDVRNYGAFVLVE